MLDALDVHGDKREQLLALAGRASESTVSWRVLHKGRNGPLAIRARSVAAYGRSRRHFQPMIVPLMQTAEYARQVLELGNWTGQKDVDAAVVARLARQQILFEPTCPQYHYLLGEIGLRWRPTDLVPLHRAQLDRIVTVSALPAVTMQVLPADSPTAALGLHGFRIYDFTDDNEAIVVFVETISGEIIPRARQRGHLHRHVGSADQVRLVNRMTPECTYSRCPKSSSINELRGGHTHHGRNRASPVHQLAQVHLVRRRRLR